MESIMAMFGLRPVPQSVIMAALRAGAQSSTALFAYGALALCWILLFASAQRLRGFSAALEDLPELQRAEIFKRSYPAFVTLGLSSHGFARRRQRRTLLLAFLALILAAGVVALAALQAQE
jgi:hypothetical protein